jgi:hypothetical protein
LKEEMKDMDVKIGKLQSDVTYWSDYKEHGCYEHKKQIHLLDSELEDMQNAFEEMTGKQLDILRKNLLIERYAFHRFGCHSEPQ